MTLIGDRYDPKQVEERWYPQWQERGYFRADPASPKPPYCIVIPPPNVTGSLHMGHALDNTIQDILIRWKRMDGLNALWVPGTDHAGIATQYVIERQLAAEGKTKEDLGREAFVARIWQWKEESGGTIIRQLQRLGASCDWERTRFTMDPGLSEAVREVFVRLWEEGLLYRGDYIVNWCPRCRTVLSDLEVEHEERDAQLFYIKYGPLTLATVRPETKFGDTALAVHPRDRRYAKYVGKILEVPSVEGTIRMKVVADEAVDPKFGTGVVKVTPAHDPADFEIGKRHGLEVRQVIGFDAMMNERAGRHAGLDRFECRKRIVEDMQRLGLMEKIEPYHHSVGVCYRCKTVVEPLVSTQWYVRTKPLAEPAIKAVRSGKIKIIPRGWAKTYYHWMENIRDWPVSRQLWWGHRIPAWYCDKDGSVHVSRTDLARCPTCGGGPRPDEGVLDTWVSSGPSPFSPPPGARGGGGGAAPGRGRAGSLVLVGALAILDARVAEGHRRPPDLLPDRLPRHRLRHPLLLGGPDGDARDQVHGRRAVPRRLSPRPDPRPRGPEDVQGQGEHHRSSRPHGQVRDRRPPLHAGGAGGAGAGHPLRGGAGGGVPQLRQQALERVAVRSDQSGGLRSGEGRRRGAGPDGPGDPNPLGRRGRQGAKSPHGVPLQRRRGSGLPVRLARVLRLVRRVREVEPLPEPRSPRSHPHSEDPRRRPRDDAPPPASIHAVHHGGDLAAAAARRGEHHAGPVSQGAEEGPRSGGREGHGPPHRRRDGHQEHQGRDADPPVHHPPGGAERS